MPRRPAAFWQPLGFTLILLGYLLVWLPHPAAGLSALGVEIGEWIKFLPGVRGGQAAADRNWFYLPPITLAYLMLHWTIGWPARRWQTWLARAAAVLVSWLAFPAWESLLEEPASEWRLRLAWVGLISLSALLIFWWPRRPAGWLDGLALAAVLAGALLPTWAYFALRPVVAQALRAPVGVGPGLWLNLIGHSLLFVCVAAQLRRRLRPTATPHP